MLITSEVLLKSKYNKDINYYKELGYEVTDDFFKVDINHLKKKSFALVDVSCDYCGDIENIPYYKLNRSLESIVKKYACIKCKGEKPKNPT